MDPTLIVLVVCAALLAFVALLVLGMMRELSIVHSETDTLMRVLIQAKPPTFLQGSLPDGVQSLLPAPNGHRHHLVLALSEGCGSCSRFLESLAEHRPGNGSLGESVTCFLKVANARSPLVRLAESVTDSVVLDRKGELFHQLEVSATPAMFAIDTKTAEVIGHHVGPDLAWVDGVLREDVNGER